MTLIVGSKFPVASNVRSFRGFQRSTGIAPCGRQGRRKNQKGRCAKNRCVSSYCARDRVSGQAGRHRLRTTSRSGAPSLEQALELSADERPEGHALRLALHAPLVESLGRHFLPSQPARHPRGPPAWILARPSHPLCSLSGDSLLDPRQLSVAEEWLRSARFRPSKRRRPGRKRPRRLLVGGAPDKTRTCDLQVRNQLETLEPAPETR